MARERLDAGRGGARWQRAHLHQPGQRIVRKRLERVPEPRELPELGEAFLGAHERRRVDAGPGRDRLRDLSRLVARRRHREVGGELHRFVQPRRHDAHVCDRDVERGRQRERDADHEHGQNGREWLAGEAPERAEQRLGVALEKDRNGVTA
jgi:hypothetical protein